MASKNVMSPVELKNHVSRNGFDLSRKVCFTAKFGQLLPVLTKEMFPGDKFKANLQEFTRTLPVNSAAFARMRHYFDFYFVPTRLLWRDFPSFVTSMADTAKQATSINQSRKVGPGIPYFTTDSVNKLLTSVESGKSSTNFDAFGFNRGKLSRRLMQYLGYYHLGKTGLKVDSGKNNVPLNPFPLLAYQKIYNDYFRFSQWENEQCNTYNIDYLPAQSDIPLTDLYVPVVSTSGGYKDFEPTMFDLRYANYNKDYFLGLLPERQYGAKATVEGGVIYGNNQPPVQRYNVGLGAKGAFNNTGDNSVNFGPDNYSTKDGAFVTGKNNLYIDGRPGYTPIMDFGRYIGNKTGVPDGINGFAIALEKNVRTTFEILALRAGEAVQKFREIAMSNSQDYKSQIEAHFGVKVSKIVSGLCEYIGGVGHDIGITEVVNTSLTGNEKATIQGKGISSGNGSVDFEAHEHGYFMCIYHASVLPDYNVQGYERDTLRVTFSDYPLPEFDKLGFEPVPKVLLTGQYSKIVSGTEGITPDDTLEIDDVPLGYAPRYFDLKTSYDILLGGFNQYVGGTLNNWVTPLDPYQILQTTNQLDEGIRYTSFKIDPHIVDPLFVARADDTLDSDPLHITCFFDLKAVRNFDRNGMPY